MAYQIELKRLPRRDLAVVQFRCSVGDLAKHIGPAFGAVHEYLSRAKIPITGPAVARYEPADREFDVSAGFMVGAPIPGDGNVVPAELPAGEAVTTTHLGSYQSLPEAYAAIKSWIATQGREPQATMWEEYWSGPETPPDQTRTDVYWPVEPMGRR